MCARACLRVRVTTLRSEQQRMRHDQPFVCVLCTFCLLIEKERAVVNDASERTICFPGHISGPELQSRFQIPQVVVGLPLPPAQCFSSQIMRGIKAKQAPSRDSLRASAASLLKNSRAKRALVQKCADSDILRPSCAALERLCSKWM